MKIQKSMIIFSRRCLVGALGITLIACGNKQQAGQAGIPEFAVITLESSVSKLNHAYPATIKGCQDVEIRPNVSGFITKVLVDEGAIVKKGQTLFLIDPVQYQEAVNVAKATVNVAKANVATAQLTADNKQRLAEKNIISLYEMQTAANTLASQKAVLAQAEAQLINASKNLSYTRVISPSNGVVGKIPFRVGSLVSPSSPSSLTTVSDNSTMYIYFSMNEKEILKLARQSNGATQGALNDMPEVELQLIDGSVYPVKGKIETLSGMIDPTTGAASARATFSNPDSWLRSGGSGVILLPEADSAAIVIPQKATFEVQDKKFVFVVTENSSVKTTEIKVLPVNDGQQYVVTSGLKAGDRIVVEGVGTSVRNGMTIKPITPSESAAKRRQIAEQQAAQKKEQH